MGFEGHMFCRVKNDSVVPLSYCHDICSMKGDCPERTCNTPRWDSWQLRRVILEMRGFTIDQKTFSVINS
jgi:hypothetical protein